MKISIVIPVYNSSNYLKKCIDSVISQTYEDLEIIFVNDGSTDNSLEILNNYKNVDNRIKILNQKNSGGIIARKNGILNATGEYCLVMDSDDWIEENTIEKLVDYSQIYDKPDLIKFRYIIEPSKEIQEELIEDKKTPYFMNKKDVLNILATSNKFNNIWNSLVKTELFNFDDSIYYRIVRKAEDLQINLQLFSRVNKYLIVNDILYHYNSNPDGVTNGITKTKYLSIVEDYHYLSNIRLDMSMNIYNIDNSRIIRDNYLKSIIDLTIKLISYDKININDLKDVQKKLIEMNIYDELKLVNINSIDINFLRRMIGKMILKKRMKNLIWFKPLLRIKKMMCR